MNEELIQTSVQGDTPMPEIEDFPSTPLDDPHAEANRLTRRALLRIALYGGGVVGSLWAFNKFVPDESGIKSLFRRTQSFNESVARSVFFSTNHRAQEFRKSLAVAPRANGEYGTNEIDADAWQMTVEGAQGGTKTLSLADIKKFPAIDQTTEFKCIEGWSTITNWTGIRFADFIAKYPPAKETSYVAMFAEPGEKGDKENSYYIGLEWASAVHPQALLAYEMNGEPLATEHGAPLRLVIPHKYGVKNIKWITRIAYTDTRPDDYWAEQGYDWYAGL